MLPVRHRLPVLLALAGALALLSCKSSTGPSGGPNDGPGTPATIVFDTSSVSLTYVGQTFTLTATIRDQNGIPMTIALSWVSSNPSVATVSGGIVRAVGPGSATITASVAGVTSSPATVTVQQVVTGVQVNPGSVWMPLLGGTEALSATARDQGGTAVPGAVFTWESTNAGVVEVSGAGVATARANGTANIRATASGVVGSAAVTVRMSEPVCGDGARIVSLIVERALADGIRALLNQFQEDLCREGYTVHERLSAFTTHVEVRNYLVDLHARSGNKLVGAILIGELPRAYQRVTFVSSNPSFPATTQTVISYQYYADLDGTFAGGGAGFPGTSANPYDVHGGDPDWEIWVGVLPRYKGNAATTVSAINRYFTKNHAYRTGGNALPRAFLQVTEHFTATTQAQHDEILQGMRDGTYAWVPFSNSAGAQLYFNSPPGGLTIQQGYTALTQGVADFTVTDAHGFWGASGQLTIAWAESNPVNTIFYWSNGCAVGDLDRPDNFLSSIVYSPTSMVLIGKGTTNDSGGMGNNGNGFFGANVARSLTSGRSFGEAILDHVNVPLIWPWSESREFHFATAIVLGDPTLRLR